MLERPRRRGRAGRWQLRTGQFAELEALTAVRSQRDALAELLARFADSGRFDRGLDRLPDGVELELRRRREG